MLETQKIPYALGIDVGSTTVKTVLLTEEGEVLSSSYERHFSKVRETVCAKLAQLAQEYPDRKLRVSITGSAGLGLAQAAELPFVRKYTLRSWRSSSAIPRQMWSSSWAARMRRSSFSPAA